MKKTLQLDLGSRSESAMLLGKTLLKATMFFFVKWDNNRFVETIKEENMTGKDRTCTCHIISTQKL